MANVHKPTSYIKQLFARVIKLEANNKELAARVRRLEAIIEGRITVRESLGNKS